MQSGSQPTNPPGQSTHTVANIIGTVIALLTLTLPLAVIARFTSSGPSPPQTPLTGEPLK